MCGTIPATAHLVFDLFTSQLLGEIIWNEASVGHGKNAYRLLSCYRLTSPGGLAWPPQPKKVPLVGSISTPLYLPSSTYDQS